MVGQTAYNTKNTITVNNAKINDYYLYHGSGKKISSFSTKSGFNIVQIVSDNGASWDSYSNLGSSVAILLCTSTTMKLAANQYGYKVWHINY